MNQEEIKKEAKQIMDSFVKALAKAPTAKKFGQERKQFVREKKAKEENKEFRQRLFKNAPKVKDDCIVAEKKSW